MLGRLGGIITSNNQESVDDSLQQQNPSKKSQSNDIEKGFPGVEIPDETDASNDPDSITADMSAFQQKTDEIKEEINRLQLSTQELEDFHKMALDDKGTSISYSNKANTLASGLASIVANIRNKLERLKIENEEIAKKLSPGHPYVRIRGAQVTQLSVSLMSTVQSFEDVQTKYRQKYQEKLQRQYKFIKPTATEDELDKLIESAGENNSSGVSLIRAQISALGDARTEARISLEQMRSRHKDIVIIEQSIVELHALFLEMRNIVYEQGDLINSIEESVEKAENYTRKADLQLRSAVTHQKARWKVRNSTLRS